MYQILHQKDLIAPAKKQLLLGILCWVMYYFGFAWILQYLFDLETLHGVYYYQIANFCASFILVTVCFFPFLKQSKNIFPFKPMVKEVLKGYGIYYVLCYIVTMWVSFLNILFPTAQENLNQAALDALLVYEPVPMILCTCILVPITEELLVRGMIFAPLCRKKPWLAYLVSASVFAAIHVIASIGEISVLNAVENFLIYFPSGLVLGWIYQHTRTIFAPILLHCTINTISVILTFALS